MIIDALEIIERLFGPPLMDTSRRAAWVYQSGWRKHFASRVAGIGKAYAFEWEALSAGAAACEAGAGAIQAYEASDGGEFLLSACLGSPPVYSCAVQALPAFSELRNAWRDDLYITRADWAWSFVLTHEDDLGPFFVTSATT